MLDPAFTQNIKIRLEAEKESVIQKLAELSRPEKPMDNPDMDDLANDATEDIIEESTRAAYHNLLVRIDAALNRIAAGTYGIGVPSGQEIPRGRLTDEPWVEDVAPINQDRTI